MGPCDYIWLGFLHIISSSIQVIIYGLILLYLLLRILLYFFLYYGDIVGSERTLQRVSCAREALCDGIDHIGDLLIVGVC